jgi:hypothetical protein
MVREQVKTKITEHFAMNVFNCEKTISNVRNQRIFTERPFRIYR